jgi:membrane-associated phospholipid phosphatase
VRRAWGRRGAGAGAGALSAGPVQARVARAVSAVSSPYLTVPAFIVASGMRYVDGPLEGLLYGAVLVATTVLLPLGHVLALRRRGLVDSIHLRERRARLGPLATAMLGAALGLAALWCLGAPAEVLRLGCVLVALAAAVLAATSVLKVSGHVTAWAMGSVVLAVPYGWWAAPLLAAAGPIAWARHALGRHTPVELGAGLLYGACVAASLVLALGPP